MKDKILEIMQGVDKANADKHYENPDKRQKTSARLIACMVKEFIEWMTCNHVFRSTYEGWAGDGISSYIDTNYNPTSSGVNYISDDSSIYSCVRYTIYSDNHEYTLDELFNYWYDNIYIIQT